MTQIVRRPGWRVAGVGAIAAALLVSGPISPVASAGVRTPSHVTGNTYGGVTAQGMPVIVDMNSTRRKVVRAVAALDLTCTSGGEFTFPAKVFDLNVNRFGKFRLVFGPITTRNDDGTTTDVQGRVTGALNDARTRITGTARLIVTDHDAAGAVTESCDSSLVSWRAKA